VTFLLLHSAPVTFSLMACWCQHDACCTSDVCRPQLVRLYEHHMSHTAASMCCGAFGGGSPAGTPLAAAPQTFGAQPLPSGPAQQICVQSLDGQLSFFEREMFAFARYLPSFLLPGGWMLLLVLHPLEGVFRPGCSYVARLA
jgi:hypothetical protein